MKLDEVFDRLLAVVFPPRCALCQCLVEYDDILCEKCEAEAAGFDIVNPTRPENIRMAVAGTLYSGSVIKAIVTYKEYPDKRIGRFFCGKILEAMDKDGKGREFDIIIPVPMSEKSRKMRGFNQAEKLAAVIGEKTGVRVYINALKRSNNSLAQHKLDREARARNALNSYKSGNTKAINGKVVLLVDDVLTTGATASVCAKLLMEAGAKEVKLAVAAFAAE